MTEFELKALYEERGCGTALAVIEEANLSDDEAEKLTELVEAWEAERIRYWRRPRRGLVRDPHEF